MLAGSDACGAVWEIPGYALHQEFDLLAEAGLAPLRILQMTTLNEVGKNADLVLLGANPVEDAAHLHDVAGVVRAGRYYSAAELDGIKRHVAASKSVQ
jgi:imidazolonepropionase-like amidohydrolase